MIEVSAISSRTIQGARLISATIASQADVGGWPELKENRRKLTIPDNPNAADDGYTNLEERLHAFAADVEGTP